MPDLKLTCDNCGSAFALSFEEEEVSYSPTHCPFCGDFYDTDSNELDFNDNDDDDYGLTDDDLNDDDEDDRRRH